MLAFAIYLTLKYIFEMKDIAKSKVITFVLLEGVALTVPMFLKRNGTINDFKKFLLIIAISIVLEIVILRIKIISSIISTMIFGTVFIVSEFLITVIITVFKWENSFVINKLKIETFVYLTFFIIVICMILLYTQSNKLMQKFISKSKENYLKLGYVAMTVVIAMINIEYYKTMQEFKESKIFIINLVAIIVYCIVSLVIVKIFNRYEREKEELEYQFFYNETLKYLMNDLRRFRHDYNNMLAVMGGYLQLKKYDDLEKYYKSIVGTVQNSNFTNNRTILEIKNAGILGLIYYKLDLAEKKNVKFSINIQTVVHELDIKINEFCEILGILLDNAIECAENTDNKMVSLEVIDDDVSKIFRITNSVQDIVDTKEIYKKGYSTKEGENRGIGLYVVDKLVRKNKNLELDTRCDGKEFMQALYLYNKL